MHEMQFLFATKCSTKSDVYDSCGRTYGFGAHTIGLYILLMCPWFRKYTLRNIALADIRKPAHLQPSHRFGPIFNHGDSIGVDVEVEDLNDARNMAEEAGRNLTDEELADRLLEESFEEENESSDDSFNKAYDLSRRSTIEGGSDSSNAGSPRMDLDPPLPQDIVMSGSSSGIVNTFFRNKNILYFYLHNRHNFVFL